MKQIQAVLCGYYGKGNGGDEALLASLLQMLPNHITPIVLSGSPEQTRSRYGVEACDRMNALEVLATLRQSEALILGGGSLIQDATSLRNPIYYCGVMGIAQRLGLKTIALAQGIGPLNRPLAGWMANRAFGGCAALSVRDRASAALLHEWGISSVMAPDLVWGLQATPVTEQLELPAPRVAVALRSHPQLTSERLACLTRAIAEFQTATDTSILLVPFQPSTDLEIAQQIQTQLSRPSQIICLEDPRELKGLFQDVEMTIGMRLHSLIMAAAEKSRCFGISYDPKVNQLMEELDIPGWDLNELPQDSNQISQAWIEHYTNGQPLSDDDLQSLVTRSFVHRDLLAAALA